MSNTSIRPNHRNLKKNDLIVIGARVGLLAVHWYDTSTIWALPASVPWIKSL